MTRRKADDWRKTTEITLGTWYDMPRQAVKVGTKAKRFAAEKVADGRRLLAPLSSENWYTQAAASCEAAGDALLREKKGATQRIVSVAAGKLGVIGVPAVIFSTAALLGTASTGTAIGSLTGAAFTSAALAWVGGSVVIGTVILTVAGIAGGVGAAIGAGWVGKKYLFGNRRRRSELDDRERRILEACLALAIAFRNEERAGRDIDPIAAKALYEDALKPLCDEMLEYRSQIEGWPYLAKKRLLKAKDGIERIASFASSFSRRAPNVTTGIIGAVTMRLLAADISDFDENEQIVLDALRRSKRELGEASDEELAAYVKELDADQLKGLSSNLLGISHELRFFTQENSDGDQYIVELFDATNHPGSDARIINTLTGDVREVQLKASNYVSYIEQHHARYADISVMATEEVADQLDNVESTGIPLEELSEDVKNVIGELEDSYDPNMLSSMSLAAMITLARNVRVLLKGASMSQDEKESVVRDGARSAVVAGLAHLLIG
jgi:hypothetical protein